METACLTRLSADAPGPRTPARLVEVHTADGRLEPVSATTSCWLEDGTLNYRLVLEPIA
jgi:hypothetical protein